MVVDQTVEIRENTTIPEYEDIDTPKALCNDVESTESPAPRWPWTKWSRRDPARPLVMVTGFSGGKVRIRIGQRSPEEDDDAMNEQNDPVERFPAYSYVGLVTAGSASPDARSTVSLHAL